MRLLLQTRVLLTALRGDSLAVAAPRLEGRNGHWSADASIPIACVVRDRWRGRERQTVCGGHLPGPRALLRREGVSMSILFGVRAADGQSIDEPRLRTLARATERYAPDGAFVAAVRNVGMGIQPYQTHERSTFEIQPAVSERGAMLCFDGRLDNHKDLRELLGLSDENVADSEIVLAAFERWEEGC